MNASKATNLIGLRIFGQHGREIGVITDLLADLTTWQLESLEVKLNRSTLEELKLKKPWFGSQTVRVPVSEISGASENLVLESVLEEMEFSGGEAETVDEEGNSAESTVGVDSQKA